jgi:hypothetical protein
MMRMRRGCTMLMGLLVVISLLTLLGAGFAQGALVAYYPFDSTCSSLSTYQINRIIIIIYLTISHLMILVHR